MNLENAIEILKIEQGVAELDLSSGMGNKNTQDFIEAVDVVINFIKNTQ